MKIVILAGGLGTRLSEETVLKPKPMVEIGGYPILWHIMHIYAHYGFNEFIVALGYKGDVIKDYFLNYKKMRSDFCIRLATEELTVYDGECENWSVQLIDTGAETQTGGRIKCLAKWLGREDFLLTYGDGVANVDINRLVKYHQSSGRLATITAVRPPSRFGDIVLNGSEVSHFHEKPQVGEGWINGGYFVLNPKVLDYIKDDTTVWEKEPLQKLTEEGQLGAYRHESFWQCMDTLREKQILEDLWSSGKAPWRVW